jgi:hypothetical protein
MLTPSPSSAKTAEKPGVDGEPTVDHLTPGIDFEMFGPDYQRVVNERLLIAPSNCGRMIVLPSKGTEGESAVSIYSKQSVEPSKAFRVTYVKAMADLWQPGSQRHKAAADVRRMDADIPASAALAVRRAWEKMLSQVTPYEKDPPLQFDPTLVEFSLSDGFSKPLAGQLPARAGRHPKALYKLGQLLVTYSQAKQIQRAEIASRIETAATRLLAELDK